MRGGGGGGGGGGEGEKRDKGYNNNNNNNDFIYRGCPVGHSSNLPWGPHKKHTFLQYLQAEYLTK